MIAVDAMVAQAKLRNRHPRFFFFSYSGRNEKE